MLTEGHRAEILLFDQTFQNTGMLRLFLKCLHFSYPLGPPARRDTHGDLLPVSSARNAQGLQNFSQLYCLHLWNVKKQYRELRTFQKGGKTLRSYCDMFHISKLLSVITYFFWKVQADYSNPFKQALSSIKANLQHTVRCLQRSRKTHTNYCSSVYMV